MTGRRPAAHSWSTRFVEVDVGRRIGRVYQKRATNREGSAHVVWLLCPLLLFLVGVRFLGGGFVAMPSFFLWLFGAWIISIAFG